MVWTASATGGSFTGAAAAGAAAAGAGAAAGAVTGTGATACFDVPHPMVAIDQRQERECTNGSTAGDCAPASSLAFGKTNEDRGGVAGGRGGGAWSLERECVCPTAFVKCALCGRLVPILAKFTNSGSSVPHSTTDLYQFQHG
eukprot:2347438-Rhodomonas_salina.1